MIKFTPDEILNVPIYIYICCTFFGILWDMIISGIKFTQSMTVNHRAAEMEQSDRVIAFRKLFAGVVVFHVA